MPEDNLFFELEERLRFETLLAEISTRYINIPVEEIDIGIEDDQFRICNFLGLDLSTLWQWSDGTPRILTVTHLHSAPGGPERPIGIDAQNSFPWALSKMLRGETIAFSTEAMGPEAAIDQASRRHFGVKSSVNIPLSVGGGPLIGVLTFDTLREERDWPDELVNRLKLVAQIFSNALIRKDSDKMLRESETRLNLAADSAGAGLWELNCSTNLFWATEMARSIFEFGSGDTISMELFEQSVFAEDLVRVREAITQCLANNEKLSIEYRILVSGGRMKWIHSTGRSYYKTNGEPDRMLGVSIDITERKSFEDQILISEARLTAAMDVTSLGFYEMDEDHYVSFLDDRGRSILGISFEEEEHGREFWLAHIHPDDLPDVLKQSKQVLAGGVDRFVTEYRYLHPERGLMWLSHLSRVLERNDSGMATRIIGVMQDITERKIMVERLQESEKKLQNNQKDLQRLAGKLISVKEEELRHLSRELHDDLTQRLAVLAIDAGKLELQMNKMNRTMPDSLKLISGIKDQLIKISEDVHRISRQLHPTILDDLGLVRAIESECAALGKREKIEIGFTNQNVPDRFPDDVPLCLYRIVQEGLNNCICHSGATKCEVVLKGSKDTIFLSVNDKGVGFDPIEVKNKPGLGLSSMRERMQLVGGTFNVETEPGRGTSIHVSIPLKRIKT